MTLKRGDQIAYVPYHAQIRTDAHWRTWNPDHPDVEFGFVTGQNDQFAFCRFWAKGQLGTLRTVANSEATLRDCLIKYESVPQRQVEIALTTIEKELSHE